MVKNLFSPQELAALNNEMVAISRGKYGPINGLVLADGTKNDTEVLQQYALFAFPHKVLANSCVVATELPRFRQ